MNRSQLLEKLTNHNASYAEVEFDHYKMLQNSKDKISQYNTQDGRRNNIKGKEHSRLNKVKQSSMKDFSATLKRVKSKQLTQRDNKNMNDTNFHTSSNKFIKNLNWTHNKFGLGKGTEYNSPKKRGKKCGKANCSLK